MAVEATIETPEVEPKEKEAPDVGAETPEEEPEAPEVTVKAIAKEMGWKGPDDYQGHEDDYVDAPEYIRRSKDIQDSMRQHLKDNKRKMSDMDRGIQDLKSHNEHVFKVQLSKQKQQIDELRKQRREAIEEGDVEKVDSLEGKMSTIYSSAEPPPDTPPSPKTDPEEIANFEGWNKTNPWYRGKDGKGNKGMTEYADRMADLPEYALLPYDRKLKTVTGLVRKAYPEQFRSKTPGVNSVEAPQGSGGKRQFTSRDLSSEQKNIMDNFVKRGIMTEKKYINDLAEIGEIG